MNDKGWIVCAGGEAHYFESDSPRCACKRRPKRSRPWVLAQDIGVVVLCEGCKAALRAPKEGKR